MSTKQTKKFSKTSSLHTEYYRFDQSLFNKKKRTRTEYDGTENVKLTTCLQLKTRTLKLNKTETLTVRKTLTKLKTA